MSGFLSAMADKLGSLAISIPAVLVVLAVVIFIHELGHFLVGRWCGVGATAFSIGFGPELVGRTDRHGTRWKLCAFPLGGYVKFVGDQNAASAPDGTELGHMSAAERAVSFFHQPVWKRAAIVAAGPIANFLLAIAIFTGLNLFVGREVIEPRVVEVTPGSAAERAGFQPGDLVRSIEGREVESFDDLRRIVSIRSQEELTIVVDRGGQPVTLTATPDVHERSTPVGKQRIGLLGLAGPKEARPVRYGLGESLLLGVRDTYNVVEQTFVVLRRIIVGRESAETMSGLVGITVVTGQVAKLKSVQVMLGYVALLSVSIGLLNLFPIPVLDGGHLVFYAIEALRGRPLNERAQEIAFRIGLAIVLMLMLFTTRNDIVRYLLPGPGT